jgi:hypothetical protein
MIRSVICIFLVSIVSNATAAADAYRIESHGIESHGDWNSRILRGKDYTIFRGATDSADREGSFILAIDYDRQHFSLNIDSDTSAPRTTTTDRMPGAMRIDEQPVHKMNAA